MKKLLTLFICIGLATTVPATNMLKTPARLNPPAADSTPVANSYHYLVFKQPDNSFGYDIYSGPRKIIHQENIPGMPGNKGFNTKEAATKVAGFVAGKLQKNIFPPTVSSQELKQLHAL